MNIHRKRISMDGDWQFWADSDARLSPNNLPPSEAVSLHVPAPWQSQRSDLREVTGGWYRRTLFLPSDWQMGRVILGVGAADYRADVWVNGQPAGHHEGGYLPFEVEVTGLAHPGENTLVIRVDDPPEGFPYVPHGKQSWYGQTSGLWQPVWVERRPDVYLKSLQVFPEPETGLVRFRAELSGPATGSLSAQVSFGLPAASEVVAEAGFALAPDRTQVEGELTVEEPRWWSPDSPNLYQLELILSIDNQPVDNLARSFGFRTIRTENGVLYLNGQPLYIRGALDQDYYPGTICTPPSAQFVEDEMRKVKALGLNLLRLHIKVGDPLYYDTADRLGLLVWTEMPNFSVLTEETEHLVTQTWEEILARDGHHPSIIAWTLINESWGIDLLNDPYHRQWLQKSYGWLKGKDPTRLVIDNSACTPNFHMESDLDDYHIYAAMPDHRAVWDNLMEEFARRPAWTYSQYGDAVRTGREPLVISEFGNWGLPDPDLLRDAQGQLPWWVDTGYDWGDGVVLPAGMAGRIRQYGLDRVFGSENAFIEATQWHQFDALKLEIEAMRRHPEIQGYVITELTDVHWECNGLMDMNRNVKVFGPLLASINSGTVLVPLPAPTAYFAGQRVTVPVALAHGEGAALPLGRMVWRVDNSTETGDLLAPAVLPGTVTTLGEISFLAPDVQKAQRLRLEMRLEDSTGQTLAVNDVNLSFYPARQLPAGGSPRVWAQEHGLVKWLVEMGCSLTPHMHEASLVVTRTLDLEMLDVLRRGAKMLLLADRPESVPINMVGQLAVRPREGTIWSGDWASSFGWLRREGALAALPGGPMVDETFEAVIPDHNLFGFGAWDFRSSVFAGQVIGWVHKPAAWLAQRRYGSGLLTATTFRLYGASPDNPVAAVLFDAITALAA